MFAARIQSQNPTVTQQSRVQYSTVQYSTVQYSTVQYSTVQPVQPVHSHCCDCAIWIHSPESTLCVPLEALTLVGVIMMTSISPFICILCPEVHHDKTIQKKKKKKEC